LKFNIFGRSLSEEADDTPYQVLPSSDREISKFLFVSIFESIEALKISFSDIYGPNTISPDSTDENSPASKADIPNEYLFLPNTFSPYS